MDRASARLARYLLDRLIMSRNRIAKIARYCPHLAASLNDAFDRADTRILAGLQSGAAIQGAIVGTMVNESTRVIPSDWSMSDLVDSDRAAEMSEEPTMTIDLAGLFADTTIRM